MSGGAGDMSGPPYFIDDDDAIVVRQKQWGGARVLSQDSDCTQRCAAAALDLHRQRDYNGAPRRQLVEVRQVLEGRNVALVQHAMRFKERRLAVIDARRIEP